MCKLQPKSKDPQIRNEIPRYLSVLTVMKGNQKMPSGYKPRNAPFIVLLIFVSHNIEKSKFIIILLMNF